jgi:adenylate kinase family enzyme
MKEYKRINIVGSSASGKSTLSKKISSYMNATHIELDKLIWEPNWCLKSDEEFFKLLENEIIKESWVIDGNYTRSIPIKWRNVELVIWIDLSFTRTLYQSLKRSIKRIVSRKEVWEGTGNKETFYRTFLSKESVIWWMIQNYKKTQKNYIKIMNDPKYNHIKFIRLRSLYEIELFIKDFTGQGKLGPFRIH